MDLKEKDESIDKSLSDYFDFEDKHFQILSSDKKRRSELLKNRYISFCILESFDWYNYDKSINLNQIKYGIANDFSHEFNFKLTKKLYNYSSSLVEKMADILLTKGFITFNKSLNKYYRTAKGTHELSIYKKANISSVMVYNNPYCKYFVPFLVNLHGMYLADEVLLNLSSMCRDSEFAYESFCHFKNNLINRNVLCEGDNGEYYLEDEVYYHIILLLAVRGYQTVY